MRAGEERSMGTPDLRKRPALAAAAVAAAVSFLAALFATPPAHAGVNIAASIGEGFVVGDGDVSRSPVNLEALPSYGIGPVHIDLGFVFHFEDRVDLLVRPGVRIGFWKMYVRVAAPMKVTDGFDYGFMAGIGAKLFHIGVLSLFLEADATVWQETDFTVVPIELRAGIEIGF